VGVGDGLADGGGVRRGFSVGDGAGDGEGDGDGSAVALGDGTGLALGTGDGDGDGLTAGDGLGSGVTAGFAVGVGVATTAAGVAGGSVDLPFVGAGVGIIVGATVTRGEDSPTGCVRSAEARTKAPPSNATVTIATTSVPVVRTAPRNT
jgi:hypothetical protein